MLPADLKMLLIILPQLFLSTARSILCEEDEEQEDIDDVNAVLIKKFILRSLIGFKFLPLYIKTSPYVKHKFNYLLPSRASAAKSCVIQPLFIKSCAFKSICRVWCPKKNKTLST